MKLRVLGSAAAEGWPALFCECPACTQARINGGKDIRRRCCYSLDQDTLIDFGPDIYWQTTQFGIDLSQIKRILFTHSHSDHLAPLELTWRRKGYSKVSHFLDVYGDQMVLDKIKAKLSENISNAVVEPQVTEPTYHMVLPGDVIQTEDLKVTAILANHTKPELGEKPLNFVIERNGITALIANDTGWWSDESWEQIKAFKLDIAIIECTMGISPVSKFNKHMSADVSVKFRDELDKLGCLKPDTFVTVNHFSHNCQNLHADFEAYFNPKGIQVAYDGMIIEK